MNSTTEGAEDTEMGHSRESLRTSAKRMMQRAWRHRKTKRWREATAPMLTAEVELPMAITLVMCALGDRRLVRVCCKCESAELRAWLRENEVPNVSHGYCEPCLQVELARVDAEFGGTAKMPRGQGQEGRAA